MKWNSLFAAGLLAAAWMTAAVGMTNPALKQFALDYSQTHKR